MESTTQMSLSSLSEMFQRRMAVFESELTRIQGVPTVLSLADDYASFKKFILETMNGLQQQIELLAATVDNLEMRGRRKMLLFHGVPEDSNENTPEMLVASVQKFIRPLNFTVTDIKRCHRMGRATSDHKPRPIIVKCQTTTIRDTLWYSKTKLKGSGITMSEFLTKRRHDTFMAARQRFGMSQCWTKEGVVYINTPDGVRHRVTKISELQGVVVKEKPTSTAKTTSKPKKTVTQSKK